MEWQKFFFLFREFDILSSFSASRWMNKFLFADFICIFCSFQPADCAPTIFRAMMSEKWKKKSIMKETDRRKKEKQNQKLCRKVEYLFSMWKKNQQQQIDRGAVVTFWTTAVGEKKIILYVCIGCCQKRYCTTTVSPNSEEEEKKITNISRMTRQQIEADVLQYFLYVWKNCGEFKKKKKIQKYIQRFFHCV